MLDARGNSNAGLNQLIGLLVGAITWYLFGYAFAYGRSLDSSLRNVFIGNYDFALHRIREANHNTTNYGYAWFIQQFFYAMVCNAIVTEGLGTRASRLTHVLSTIYTVGFLFPVIAHGVWSSDGWMSPIRPENVEPLGTIGAIDFGGSGVVHILGASVAFAAALLLRKRGKRPAPVQVPEEGPAAMKMTIGAFFRIFAAYTYGGRSTFLFWEFFLRAFLFVRSTSLSEFFSLRFFWPPRLHGNTTAFPPGYSDGLLDQHQPCPARPSALR